MSALRNKMFKMDTYTSFSDAKIYCKIEEFSGDYIMQNVTAIIHLGYHS